MGKASTSQHLASVHLHRGPGSGPHIPLGGIPAIAADTLVQQAIQHYQQRDLTTAASLLEAAIGRDPKHAVAHNCLGMVYRAAGRLEASLQYLLHAVKLAPQLAAAHNNLGNTLCALGRSTEAIACYRRAIELDEQMAEAHNNLAAALVQLGRSEQALSSCQRALQINGNYPAAWNNLGNVLRAMNRLEEAQRAYERALQIHPDAQVLVNVGSVLRDRGRSEEAMAAFRAAIELNAECADAWDQLATTHADRIELTRAIECYDRALTIAPTRTPTWINLGNAYNQQQRVRQAADAYHRAFETDPEQPLHYLRARSVCPLVYLSQQAAEKLREQLLATWRAFSTKPLKLTLRELSRAAAEPPFNLQFLSGNLRPLKEAYADIFQPHLPQLEPLKNHDRPRIGLVVTRQHEGIFLKSLAGVLSRLRSRDWDLVVIGAPEARQRITAALPQVRFQPLPNQFEQAVNALRFGRFDVLYYWEIGTDLFNYFLPMLRLAPVQCTSWGVQVTSGLANMDFYLSSSLVEPDDAATHYREQLLFAPTLLTFRERVAAAPGQLSRSHWGIGDHEHIYLCAQNLGKFHPDFDFLISEILRQDGQGTVVITEDRHRFAAEQLRRRFRRTIGDVAHRIRFVPRQNPREYSQLMAAADVVLDPPHFGGVNTTYDALGHGKPIVTLPSPLHRGRYTLGCYRKMGFYDAVAPTPQHYVQLAVQIGTDVGYREQLSQNIRERSAELFEDLEAVQQHRLLFERLLARARRGTA